MEYTKQFLYRMKYNLDIGKLLSKKKYNLEDKNVDLTTKSSKEYNLEHKNVDLTTKSSKEYNLKHKNLSTKSFKEYKDKLESSYESLDNRRHSCDFTL
jgi:hypothetical protein